MILSTFTGTEMLKSEIPMRSWVILCNPQNVPYQCHHACLRDTMSQTYPTYACSGTNHMWHFIDSWYILRLLEARA